MLITIIVLNFLTMRRNYQEELKLNPQQVKHWNSEKCTNLRAIKVLSNFERLLEIPLTNCIVELKSKWTKYCVLAPAGAHNADVNSDNVIFIIKYTKLYAPVITLSANNNKKVPRLLSKVFERSEHWDKFKTKSENNKIFQDHTLQDLTDFLCWPIQIKMAVLKDSKLKYITNKKVLSKIITSFSMGKAFLTDQLILI